VITTLGERGCVLERGGESAEVAALGLKRVVDPTGAGDAFRAGAVEGLLNGGGLERAGRLGNVAAAYAVEKFGTTNHHYSRAEFEARLAAAYG